MLFLLQVVSCSITLLLMGRRSVDDSIFLLRVSCSGNDGLKLWYGEGLIHIVLYLSVCYEMLQVSCYVSLLCDKGGRFNLLNISVTLA